jgi:radical SAM superfamily enzyme YgiQ (UPF0313 family)
MRRPGDILLISTYELGHQPIGLAMAAAFLERAGFRPRLLDLAVDPVDEEALRAAQLVAVSVPMHTALRLGAAFAARLRAVNPGAALCFFGLYAPLNADWLRSLGASAVLGGECEAELVRLAESLETGSLRHAEADPPEPGRGGAFVHLGGGAATRAKLDFPVPSRAALPPLERYARLREVDGSERLAGHVEASRGCLHHCRHCPIPPVYLGRFFAVPAEVVLADIERQVAAGATHITFGDPDFLNGPGHGLQICRELHARWPQLTFDFTAKVEHLLQRAELLPELARLGALFVTTALESLSDLVLTRLAKGHSRADAIRVFSLCAGAGIALRPSLVAFTPWTTMDDYIDVIDTLEAHGLLGHLDPIQLAIRLLVPPGSLLLELPDLEVKGLDPAALSWRWDHPDPRMDGLYRDVSQAVEQAAARKEPPLETIAATRRLALAAAGRPHERAGAVPPQPPAPRLTESWFCCAEPTAAQLAGH